MDRWSVFRNVNSYEHLQANMDIKAPGDKQTVKIFAKLDNDECVQKYIDHGKPAGKVNEGYLDIYEGIQLELNYVAMFDETTYLAIKARRSLKEKKSLKDEESFP